MPFSFIIASTFARTSVTVLHLRTRVGRLLAVDFALTLDLPQAGLIVARSALARRTRRRRAPTGEGKTGGAWRHGRSPVFWNEVRDVSQLDSK